MKEKLLKGNFTREEIASQIDSWEKIYNKIQSGDFRLGDQIFKAEYDTIVLFGCGSSYNIAISAAFYTNLLTDHIAISVPSSELLFNKEAYLRRDKKYLLVGFSRSGETTESINVVKNLKEIPSFIFTCQKDNSLKEISKYSFYCDGAEEKSVVMTKSFSSMLFAYCVLLATVYGASELVEEFRELIDYMKTKTSELFVLIEDFIKKKNFDNFFSLGNGFNYGMALEADLKIKEMTQIPSYSYNIMEFNHGPKSLIDNTGLIMFLTVGNYFSRSISSMFEDFSKLGSEIVLIGKKGYKNNTNSKITRFLSDERFKNDLVGAFINIPVFQIMSYYKTLSLSLDPDKPRNLEYTTKLS